MNIISAYHQVGTYRGAAEPCGTTHKTVKRVIERAEAGRAAATGTATTQCRCVHRAGRYPGREVEGQDVGEADVADCPCGRLSGLGT
jgi:hypothetical protein